MWQEKALTHAAELFESADSDHDGILSCHELLSLMRKVRILALMALLSDEPPASSIRSQSGLAALNG